ALLEFAENARLSKELVTIRDDLPVRLELDVMKTQEPDNSRLRDIYVELEFHSLAKAFVPSVPQQGTPVRPQAQYQTVDTIDDLLNLVEAARQAGMISIDTETLVDTGNPPRGDPLRSKLVSLALAIAPGKAYYLPFAHVQRRNVQSELLIDAPGDRAATDAPAERGLIRGGVDPVSSRPKRKSKPSVTSANRDNSPES